MKNGGEVVYEKQELKQDEYTYYPKQKTEVKFCWRKLDRKPKRINFLYHIAVKQSKQYADQ